MFEIGKLTRIPLGMQGENNSRSIQVDMKAWLDDWPGATINLLVRRPGEDGFYPANTVINDGVLTWVPTRADVLIAGEGEAQFILTDADDVELRSRVVKTVINESLSGTQGEAPDPETGWVAEVLDAATRAEEAAKRAENAGGGGAGATGADGGFYTPTAEQTDASTLRVSFAASKENMPAVDAVDITLPKGDKGEKGEAGAQGPKGDTGPAGPQGEKGDTGATGPAGAIGPQGPAGADGEKGDKGDKGDTGATGPQGPTGETGPQGPKGDTGAAGADGKTPAKGTDYFTDADKAEMVQAVIAALPVYSGEVV